MSYICTCVVRILCAVFADEKTRSAECVQNMHEPVVQVPQHLGVPKCEPDQITSKTESRDEDESEEYDEDAAEFHAPIELLAEVRHLYSQNFI